jgi:hypothetical protein
MFSEKVCGDIIPIKAQNVEKEVVQAVFYAAPRATKSKRNVRNVKGMSEQPTVIFIQSEIC